MMPLTPLLAAAAPAAAPAADSLPLMFLFAFLGGLILNIMPCVLPVLSIKVLSLVEQSSEHPTRIRRHGYAYTAGVLASFAAIAVPFAILDKGWGFQFQEPAFVAGLAAVIFAFALSLFGVYELNAPGATQLEGVVARQHGYASSFVYGVFAVVLATPCTAPFLAPALGFAVTQPPVLRVALLEVIGLGLATPFLLLAVVPVWARWLPKPGPWMDTFKKLMGFLLVGTAIWLLDTLRRQVTGPALMDFLIFLMVVAGAAFVYGHWAHPMRGAVTRLVAMAVAAAAIVGGAFTFLGLERPAPVARIAAPVAAASCAPCEVQGAAPGAGSAAAAPAAAPKPSGPLDTAPVVQGDEIRWRDFARVDVNRLAASGNTVFVDFTASWCATCKVNESTVIDTDAIRAELRDLAIVPVRADYTNEDPEITKWLKRFHRAGVPMYVILPAGRPADAVRLPDRLTTDGLTRALRAAGPSKHGA